MYRLLACDIDHTILPPGGTISAPDIAAFHRLHQAGVLVVLASGRATVSTRRILDGIFRDDPPDYLISFNGARVDSLVERFTLWSSNLPIEVISELSAWARDAGVYLQGYNGEQILVEQDNPYIRSYQAAAGIEFRIVSSIADAVAPLGGAPKLVIHDLPQNLPAHIETLRSLSRGRWDVVTSIPTFVEVVSAGTNKGTALHVLAEHLGFSMSEIIAVGDNLNDIEMIREAGTGVAVANAVPELKAIADWVTTRDAEHSALAEVVDRFF